MSVIGTALWKRKSKQQGWGDMSPLTRKEKKALRQHDAADKKPAFHGGYKARLIKQGRITVFDKHGPIDPDS